ncbi:hypothetical protein WH47_05699 [Habropoda laboriosa]|uniref:Uncharacterized protein n=1 Tax=Habropoda laboriosa TaxID=597456 RepID=A0A0L7QR00_9HYME|nr:hypothetical protein WH47_05699 [Habropoda laboriosa]
MGGKINAGNLMKLRKRRRGGGRERRGEAEEEEERPTKRRRRRGGGEEEEEKRRRRELLLVSSLGQMPKLRMCFMDTESLHFWSIYSVDVSIFSLNDDDRHYPRSFLQDVIASPNVMQWRDNQKAKEKVKLADDVTPPFKRNFALSQRRNHRPSALRDSNPSTEEVSSPGEKVDDER